jgi:signal transduction histidine kinase
MDGKMKIGAQPYTILMVDDSPTNLAAALEPMVTRGFQVALARSGQEAMEQADLVRPDLILLDVLMPGMDGFETCRRLKASESTKEIPVIFMTALAETSDKLAAFKVGGVDYVIKPFNADEVIARVETHLTLREMRKQVEVQNAQLQHEIAMRRQFESALRRVHDELEQKVAERTVELADANAVLKKEISERKRAEREREALLASEQAARSKAEAADRLKDEFLAILSHELRTPLTAISGWARLLHQSGLDIALVKRGVEVIERNAWAELQIIEDLLDVSVIIRGQMELKAQPVCLASILQTSIDSIKLAADAKGVRISLSLSTTTSMIWGDRRRLEQIIRNLLSNAVKFTPSGGRVTVSLEEVGSMTRIRISDTGEGISPEFLVHMFERFRQADSSTKRRHGGLGLGLSIVRHMVEMHGGVVTGESEGQGKGATFTVDLPMMPPVNKTAAAPPVGTSEGDDGSCASMLSGVRVLVIDDEPDARELVMHLLTMADAEVRMASATQEGFEILEQWRPDVLVSDIGLPGEDGYVLIRRIRALPADRGGQTPAAALTAYAGQEAHAQALSAGYQLHIPKPIDRTAFLAAIAALAGRGRQDKDGS